MRPTEGPWTFNGGDSAPILHLYGPDGKGLFHRDRPLKEQEANAKLMAASRDLLEVAKDVAKLPCSTFGHEDMESGCCPSCRARSAITKALA